LLYKAMSSGDKGNSNDATNPLTNLALQVQGQAGKTLDYFEKSNNIVRAGSCEAEMQKWDKSIADVINSAYDFDRYGNGNSIIAFMADDSISIFHSRLITAIRSILEIIDKEKKRNG